MKSMSWICQGRLGEYHYYCPFANVDSLYPQGLRSNPSPKKKKGWADDKDWKSSVTGKFRLHQFSERWISFLTTPMKSIVPKIKVLTFSDGRLWLPDRDVSSQAAVSETEQSDFWQLGISQMKPGLSQITWSIYWKQQHTWKHLSVNQRR